ncbi:MAG: helix-turn-helix domain-containing protein [Gemmatimonadaceae bacterium]|nr:helix-turn-helix domain-containing protein [Gemmatimonadaceae bacterium]
MEARLQFVRDALSDRFTMSELCARYGVSRRIGYKWLARYEAEGRPGLQDRSRAPISVRIVFRRRSKPSSCRSDRRTRSGAHGSCSRCSRRAFRRFRGGRRRAPPRIYSLVMAWCKSVGGGACRPIRGLCDRPPRHRMICGPPTSKGSFVPGMGGTAIR